MNKVLAIFFAFFVLHSPSSDYYCGVTIICPECNGVQSHATCELSGSTPYAYRCKYRVTSRSVECTALGKGGFILGETISYCPDCDCPWWEDCGDDNPI